MEQVTSKTLFSSSIEMELDMSAETTLEHSWMITMDGPNVCLYCVVPEDETNNSEECPERVKRDPLS